MHSEFSPRIKKKQKVDKSKGVIPLVLTNGETDKIGENFQEVAEESWG